MKEDADNISKIIADDLYRYLGSRSFLSFVRTYITCPGFRYTIFYRLTKHYKMNKSWFRFIVCTLIMYRLRIKFGFQISYRCTIGRGLYLGHFGTVIINPEAVLGSNVNIAPGVTIGQTNRGGKKGVPKIGNNVWIGANAVIVGNIMIGDNVMIAPNSYVNNDIPSNAVVIGNPGKIVSDEGVSSYICNVVN